MEIVGESIAIGLNLIDVLFSFQNTRKVCMKKGGGGRIRKREGKEERNWGLSSLGRRASESFTKLHVKLFVVLKKVLITW